MTRLARRRFLRLAAAFAALPAAARAAGPQVWRGRAFGAEAQIVLHAPEPQARAAFAALAGLIARMEHLFSLHDPASSLSQLNAAGRLAPPPPEMAALLALCDRVHAATGGRFDPTVQPLWQALARGGDAAAARAAVGWGRVRHGPDGVALAPGQALTLNGIAQGFAADAARALLVARGFGRVLADLGEFAALGGPWRLGLEDPGLGLHATRTIADAALATSSPAALMLAPGVAHILDPAGGGGPVWSSVTVEADSAALADGLSTAACLMPRAELAALRGRVAGLRAVVAVSPQGEVETF